VGMLSSLGVSVEAALAATLLLRALTFWLPMLPGIWLARRELRRPQAVRIVSATGAPST
jgi:glycosyltransferase 2 family protein